MEWTHHNHQTRPLLCVFAKVLGAEGENTWKADRLEEEQAEYAPDAAIPWQL